MARNIEFEMLQYRTREIEEASLKLVTLFAKHSNIEGTFEWMSEMLKFQNDIREQKVKSTTLMAKGVELIFSGFPNPIPVIEDEAVVYVPRDLRFTIEDKPEELRPSGRTHIQNVTNAIALEMNEVYHLQIQRPPMMLLFPREEYVDEVTRINAVML